MTGLTFLAPSILVANLLGPLILPMLWSPRRHPSAVLSPSPVRFGGGLFPNGAPVCAAATLAWPHWLGRLWSSFQGGSTDHGWCWWEFILGES
jgi:hypothetical protein